MSKRGMALFFSTPHSMALPSNGWQTMDRVCFRMCKKKYNIDTDCTASAFASSSNRENLGVVFSAKSQKKEANQARMKYNDRLTLCPLNPNVGCLSQSSWLQRRPWMLTIAARNKRTQKKNKAKGSVGMGGFVVGAMHDHKQAGQ